VRLFLVFRAPSFGLYLRMAPAQLTQNSNQEQRNSGNTELSQGLADGTQPEQGREQLPAGSDKRAEEPPVTDVRRVWLHFVVRVSYYRGRMIRSCRDREVQQLLDRKFSRKFQAIEKAARVRLALLDVAASLRDLNLPGLHLEALKGDRKGQHSIRINDQFRICFEWRDRNAHNVEIVDYH